jgi:hypothetical protein
MFDKYAEALVIPCHWFVWCKNKVRNGKLYAAAGANVTDQEIMRTVIIVSRSALYG